MTTSAVDTQMPIRLLRVADYVQDDRTPRSIIHVLERDSRGSEEKGPYELFKY